MTFTNPNRRPGWGRCIREFEIPASVCPQRIMAFIGKVGERHDGAGVLRVEVCRQKAGSWICYIYRRLQPRCGQVQVMDQALYNHIFHNGPKPEPVYDKFPIYDLVDLEAAIRQVTR